MYIISSEETVANLPCYFSPDVLQRSLPSVCLLCVFECSHADVKALKRKHGTSLRNAGVTLYICTNMNKLFFACFCTSKH